MPLGRTGESRIATGHLGLTPFLEEVCVNEESGWIHPPVVSPSNSGEGPTVPLTARLTCGLN